jgi:hypothetical protein
MVTALLLILIAIGALVEGQNTPPEIELETPAEGTQMAMLVTVSGTATDAEGFNISSKVEVRWNTWEWFEVPSTPAQGGFALYYGQTVDLQWHAPGEHNLLVRAFDGELYSETVNITVVKRDLPDLVILPMDIMLNPDDGRDGSTVDVVITVHNHGGEDIEDVEVTLFIGDREIGRDVIDTLKATSSEDVSFLIDLEAGNLTIRANANALGQVQETSQANNFAERSFNIPQAEITELSFPQLLLLLSILAIFTIMVLWALYNPK